MYTVIIILTVLVAILLIGIVLIQKSKGGGLSSQFGGVNSTLGVRQTNTFIEKATWTLAALIALLSIASSFLMPKSGNAVQVRTTTEVAAPAAPTTDQFPVATPVAPVETAAEADGE